MTPVFIDPSAAVDGDGSIDRPFQSWSSVSPESNGVYLQKAGTSERLADAILLSNLSDVTIGRYGWGDNPILENYLESTSASDWVEGPTNVWAYKHNLKGYSFLLGLGELNQNVGDRVPYLDSSGGADVSHYNYGDFGSSKTTNTLYIYSDINPVTKWGTVFWGVLANRVFNIVDSDYINLSGFTVCNAIQGVNFFPGTGTHGNTVIRDLFISQCNTGLMIGGDNNDPTAIVDNLDIYNIVIRQTGAAGIQYHGHVKNFQIYGCDVADWGTNESTGGIYGGHLMAAPGFESAIFNNRVSGGSYGKYWNDGDGIYLDNGSYGVRVFDNYVHDLPDSRMAAFRDNSGGERMSFVNNYADRAGMFIKISDSKDNNNIDCVVAGNVGTNLIDGVVVRGNCKVGSFASINNSFVGAGSATDINENATVRISDIDNSYSGFAE